MEGKSDVPPNSKKINTTTDMTLICCLNNKTPINPLQDSNSDLVNIKWKTQPSKQPATDRLHDNQKHQLYTVIIRTQSSLFLPSSISPEASTFGEAEEL